MPFESELPKAMYWKEDRAYTIDNGVYQYREVWEMVEETNDDDGEKVFTCINCNCKFKPAEGWKYHCGTSHTPTRREFLKPVENVFSLGLPCVPYTEIYL